MAPELPAHTTMPDATAAAATTSAQAAPTAGMGSASRYLVRAANVPGYRPANHSYTLNQRLIGPETVGARQMEVLLGTLRPGATALPHAHPGIEQACYLLEGTARAEVAGEAFDMQPGDICFFPADKVHSLTVTSATPVRLLVIYSPPCGVVSRLILPVAGTTGGPQRGVAPPRHSCGYACPARLALQPASGTINRQFRRDTTLDRT